MIKLHHHYSLTLNWIKAKAKTTNWRSWEEKYGYVHLYRVLYKFIYIHWFSYTFKNDLLEILEKTIDPINHPLNFLFFKLVHDYNIESPNYKKSFILKTKSNKYLFKYLTSKNRGLAENFILDLKNWSEESLTKNWKRNLMRSRRKSSNISYRSINIENYLDEVYSVIIANSNLKQYKYPYSLNFLKEIIKDSYESIETYAAFNSNGKIIAVRSFYKNKGYGIDFIAAALPEAMKIYVTYKLAFLIISKAKKDCLKFYDLGGVNNIENIGVYNFKKGIGGKLIKDGQMTLGIKFSKLFPDFLMIFFIRLIDLFL